MNTEATKTTETTKCILLGDVLQIANSSFAYPPFYDFEVIVSDPTHVTREPRITTRPTDGEGGSTWYYEVYSFRCRGTYHFSVHDLRTSHTQHITVHVS